MGSEEVKVALLQLNVTECKQTNLERANCLIEEAAKQGALIVVLPEAFNCPYTEKFLKASVEAIAEGETSRMLSEAARRNGVYVVAGIPEVVGSQGQAKQFNACPVFGPSGEMIAKHRKIFLAVTDVTEKMVFEEDAIFGQGNKLTTFDVVTNGVTCRAGVGICREARYPEVAIAYRDLGCHLVVYPGAFNPEIGQDHYELLHRSRALDSQIYVAAVCPARDENGAFVAYGNSMLVDPWGRIVNRAGTEEEIIYGNVDLNYLAEVRKGLPVTRSGKNAFFNQITIRENSD